MQKNNITLEYTRNFFDKKSPFNYPLCIKWMIRTCGLCVCVRVHVVSETAHMPLHRILGRPAILLSFNTARAHIYIYVYTTRAEVAVRCL